MPRARKGDKFFAYATKKDGDRKGQIFLGVNGIGTASIQDLLDFLKEKGIDPHRVPLPGNFMAYAKPEKKYPPISPGTSVETTQPNWSLRREWTDEGWTKLKWGVRGTVIAHHDSHGLCYDVKHEDGSGASYDPTELKVL